MNSWFVFLFSENEGPCWVEILKDDVQQGKDIDCETRRKGLAVARRECKRLGLSSFTEHHIHRCSVKEKT